MSLLSLFLKKKKYVLVISGGGARGFYAMGILKGLEELGMKERIDAIYGVSAGAIAGTYRAAGYSAQEIFDIFFAAHPFGFTSLNVFSKESLFKLDYFKKQFTQDLPKEISGLKIKTYIGTTDVNNGIFLSFDKGDLVPILLGSMSIPGFFPAVKYKDYVLIDGGATNNFPVELAKKEYPGHEIIGIALDKFRKNQKISNMFDNLSVSFEILLRHQVLDTMGCVRHLFYKELPVNVLDANEKNMQKAYFQGYQDCMEHFK